MNFEAEFGRLIPDLNRSRVALFLGADLPREVASLPSRADLAREMARRYHLDESLSLAEVAQRVSQVGNRFEFTDFIRNALDTAGKPLPAFHQGIVTLVKKHSIGTIITTAYDNLLEVAFQQAGVGFNRIVRNSDVSFARPDRPTLIKLYGDVQQPETLVVTERDHSQLMRDRDKEDVINEVRQVFKRKTTLFYGYDLSDPDFRFLFDQVADSQFAHTAYVVWPGLPEADVRMWRDSGIVILDEDPLNVLSVAPMTHPQSVPSIEVNGPTLPSLPDNAAVRQFLMTYFSDEEITALCCDRFSEVYNNFAAGMSKGQKVQQLIDYARQRDKVPDLLSVLQTQRPTQYVRQFGAPPTAQALSSR